MRYILGILIFFVWLPNIYANEKNANSYVDDIYVEHLINEDFKSAYEYVSQGTDRESLLQRATHLMFGTGVEKDECEAVLILEKAYEVGRFRTISALNFIYGQSWSAIARYENSGAAFFENGLYYYNVPDEGKMSILGGDKYIDEKALNNFMQAKDMGYKQASEFIDIILKRSPELKSFKPTKLTPVSVKCPIREAK